MPVSSGVKHTIALQSLAELAVDNHLAALDFRVLLYMIGNCTFRVLEVFTTDAFHVAAPEGSPAGTVGCFVYNGKRTELCDALNYAVPQNVSRSINALIRQGHLARTNLLGLRTLFAFIVHPKFFGLAPVAALPPIARRSARSGVESTSDSG